MLKEQSDGLEHLFAMTPVRMGSMICRSSGRRAVTCRVAIEQSGATQTSSVTLGSHWR